MQVSNMTGLTYPRKSTSKFLSVNKMVTCVLLLVMLNPEVILSQQLFMLLTPGQSQSALSFASSPTKQLSPYPNFYPQKPLTYNGNRNDISSSENEIESAEEVTNFRPIYVIRQQLHDQTQIGPSYQRSSSNFFLHSNPPHISPLFLREYGSGSRNSVGGSPSKFWLPNLLSGSQQVMEDRRDDYDYDNSEMMFNVNQNVNSLFLDSNNNFNERSTPSMGKVSSEEQEEYDNDNNISSDDKRDGSGSGESDLGDVYQPNPHHFPFASNDDDDDNNDDILPPPPMPTQLSPLVDQLEPNQRCILEGHQARFDPITGGCFTVGTKGPCGKFMIFSFIPDDNINGYCDCDYDSFDRPIALVGGKCQFLYTQAGCFAGYWLTGVTPNGKPICQENPCQSPLQPSSSFKNGNAQNSIVLFKGECIKLNGPSRHCWREGEVVLFPKGSTTPACGFPKSTKRIYRRQISNINRFVCGPGMRRHRVTKRCIRTVRRALVFH